MKKENIALLAQLLTSMNEAVDKLEEARKANDMEKLSSMKKEVLRFQKKIKEIYDIRH